MYRAHRRFIGPCGFHDIPPIVLKIIIGPLWFSWYPYYFVNPHSLHLSRESISRCWAQFIEPLHSLRELFPLKKQLLHSHPRLFVISRKLRQLRSISITSSFR